MRRKSTPRPPSAVAEHRRRLRSRGRQRIELTGFPEVWDFKGRWAMQDAAE